MALIVIRLSATTVAATFTAPFTLCSVMLPLSDVSGALALSVV